MLRALLALSLLPLCLAQTPPLLTFPGQTENDFTIPNFQFASGESIKELRLHYITIGTPQRDASGRVTNAVLIMHGTGGTARPFTNETFGGQLFQPGQPLDAAKYFLILPDAIGHGKSSKPSDGLRTRFPRYRYADMIRANHALLTDGLKVDHLRLVLGTSMGAMQTWLWGEMYPDFMDALMPLASAPVEIVGRNRMFRAMIIGAIRGDPAWKNGNYRKEPEQALVAAQYVLTLMGGNPAQLHKSNPTRERADAAVEALRNRARTIDANDTLYQFEASLGYNPSPTLATIRAPLYAVNSADDAINPPELGILEREIAKVPRGRYILIPSSDETRGHGTHSRPAVWKNYLTELLNESR